MNVSWMTDPTYLAEMSHFLAGGSLMMLSALFSKSWKPVLITLAIGFVAASLKEFIFDLTIEGDNLFGSTIDWSFYLLGAAIGLVIVSIAWRNKANG